MMKLLAASILLVGATASADTVIREPQHRDGFVIGATIDGGHIGCQTENGDDCGSGMRAAGGFSVLMGGMLTPSLALTGEVWGMAHTHDDLTASQLLVTANLRAWLLPRLWVQGGVGAARSTLTLDDGDMPAATQSTSDVVPAGVAAIGVELVHSASFALDLQLRGGSGFYRGDARVWNTALGIGATWY